MSKSELKCLCWLTTKFEMQSRCSTRKQSAWPSSSSSQCSRLYSTACGYLKASAGTWPGSRHTAQAEYRTGPPSAACSHRHRCSTSQYTRRLQGHCYLSTWHLRWLWRCRRCPRRSSTAGEKKVTESRGRSRPAEDRVSDFESAQLYNVPCAMH